MLTGQSGDGLSMGRSMAVKMLYLPCPGLAAIDCIGLPAGLCGCHAISSSTLPSQHQGGELHFTQQIRRGTRAGQPMRAENKLHSLKNLAESHLIGQVFINSSSTFRQHFVNILLLTRILRAPSSQINTLATQLFVAETN